jgi:predicted transcriptional regulator
MANKVIIMQQIRALIQLLEKGHSLRSIAVQLGLSRQPVTSYAARLRSSSCTLAELRQLTDEELAKIVYGPVAEPKLSDPERRQALIERMEYFISGPDGTRTRDLCRDRAAF